jgi:membrane protein
LGVITQFVDFLPPNAEAILPEINFGLIWVVFTFVFAILFKLLPDAKIAWKDVWLGAAVTSILFTLGEFLIGYYLGRINLGFAFGTASSIILILVWIYYSMQIILFGAKFTHVYANKYGSGIEASSIAELVVSQPINDLLESKQDK